MLTLLYRVFLHCFTGVLAVALITGTPAQTSSSQSRIDELLSQTLGQETAIPSVEQAILVAFDGDATVTFDLLPNVYIYKQHTQFLVTMTRGDTIPVAPSSAPTATLKWDEYFGDSEVWLAKNAPLDFVLDIPANAASLTIEYQGCLNDVICYPPQRITIPLSSVASAAVTTPPASSSVDTTSDQSLAELLADESLIIGLVLFYILGIGLTFTPCVLPMVPILSAMIAGSRDASRHRKLALTGAYVLSMALTYAAAGSLVGLLGGTIQASFQHPLSVAAFALMFVALATSMYGVFELKLPRFLDRKAREAQQSTQGGSIIGTAAMGSLSAIVVSPCVAAPLAGALLYIADTGDALYGGSALFALGLGMGTPLLAVGGALSRWLPKAGSWMEAFSRLMGIGLFGVAVWMAERLWYGPATLVAWAFVIGLLAWELMPKDRLRGGSNPIAILRACGSLVLAVWAVACVFGAASGHADVTKPLPQNTAAAAPASDMDIPIIHSVDDLNAILLAHRGQPVVVDFYADWCVSCVVFERQILPQPQVQRALEGIVLVKADVTANDAAHKKLMQTFQVVGPPTFLLFGPDGMEQRHLRIVGEPTDDAFAQRMLDLAAIR